MGRKNKLQKFSEVLNFKNVVENFDFLDPKLTYGPENVVEFKGEWTDKFFNNDKPLILELACGRGEYCLALGRNYPDKNFLGVDIKGARIWKGAKNAIDQNLPNVGFLRSRIEQVHLFFAPHEVSEIWITFPDPFIFKERNRLTHHRFLDLYAEFLKPGGIIHLKTDDATLYESSVESFNNWGKGNIVYQNDDIYSAPLYSPDLEHKTYYEKMHMGLGKKIKYVKVEMGA